MKYNVERRQFLCAASRMAVAVGIAAGSLGQVGILAAEEPRAGQTRQDDTAAMLAELAYLLLPIRERDDQVYPEVAFHLLQQARRNPATEQIIKQGLRRFRDYAAQPWLSLLLQARQDSVAQQYDTAFIEMLRWATQEVVLRDRRVWKQVGYQGSSIEYGGYLHRGFDDIDWLPEPPKVKTK